MSSNEQILKYKTLPGEILPDKRLYKFPTLYSKTKSGKIKFWQLYIRLISSVNQYEHDWDLQIDNVQPIKSSYYDSYIDTPIAQIYNEQGFINGKVSRHPPTIIKEGSKGLKNNINRRNAFTQALINANSMYEKKKDAGYTEDPNVKVKSNALYYAMAAHEYDKNTHRLEFPLYCQTKLDGVRCIMKYDAKTNTIMKYSRDQKLYNGYDEFDPYLIPIFKMINKQYGGELHLDGELYKHGKRLQDIVGVARNENKAFDLSYYVFDLFIIGSDKPCEFDKRYMLLEQIFEHINYDRIILVQTDTIMDQEELDSYYQLYIDNKFEGQMVRIPDKCYEYSQYRELRSYSLLKRKKKYTKEWAIIDFTQGENGRAKGTFIGIFENENGKRFNVSPKNMTMDEMRELYKKVKNNWSDYKGKLATIEYEDLSKDNIPLRPKFIMFREIA